jgi:tetratricopeptide (TPR) repeat protein
MRKLSLLLWMIATWVVVVVGANGQTVSASAGQRLSPAEQAIAVASRLIEKNPRDFEAYNALALAQSRRARETSDPRYYSQAEEALKKSFEISPDNFDGERIRVWLLLGKHEFAPAREAAIKLNKRAPDDVMVYGFLTDANVELGNYEEAEKAAQMMLDLRPGNIPGVTRGAYLRELFGDVDGALELMNMALASTPPAEVEDAAWISTQMAHLNFSVGKIAEAESQLQRALHLFPDYHYALANLAKIRIEQKRYEEAVELLRTRYSAAPHAENLYDLAETLELAGHKAEAAEAFHQFEVKSLAETGVADNSNHELILYFADHAHDPAKALEVAKREVARRHDVFTLDCYAWALHVNGQDREARTQIDKALAVGIRNARFLRHASEIALSLGDRSGAEKLLRQSVSLNSLGSERAQVPHAQVSDSKMAQVHQ